MDIRKTIAKAMAKPMDRREFFMHTGAMVLAVLGVTAALRSLGLHDASSRSAGYDSSPYGGRER